MRGAFRTLLFALVLTALASSISAQFHLFGPRSPKPTPAPRQMRKASAYISSQAPLKVNQSLLNQATPGNVHVVVSLPNPRTYFMIPEQIVAHSPISSGTPGH